MEGFDCPNVKCNELNDIVNYLYYSKNPSFNNLKTKNLTIKDKLEANSLYVSGNTTTNNLTVNDGNIKMNDWNIYGGMIKEIFDSFKIINNDNNVFTIKKDGIIIVKGDLKGNKINFKY